MKYIEEGDTLSLTPDVSTIEKPFGHSIWRMKGWVAENKQKGGGPPKYFGSYENRTHLNNETLQLDIDRLTVADSGTFSLEIDDAPVGRYPVKVIRKCVCVCLCVSVCLLLCVGGWVYVTFYMCVT